MPRQPQTGGGVRPASGQDRPRLAASAARTSRRAPRASGAIPAAVAGAARAAPRPPQPTLRRAPSRRARRLRGSRGALAGAALASAAGRSTIMKLARETIPDYIAIPRAFNAGPSWKAPVPSSVPCRPRRRVARARALGGAATVGEGKSRHPPGHRPRRGRQRRSRRLRRGARRFQIRRPAMSGSPQRATSACSSSTCRTTAFYQVRPRCLRCRPPARLASVELFVARETVRLDRATACVGRGSSRSRRPRIAAWRQRASHASDLTHARRDAQNLLRRAPRAEVAFLSRFEQRRMPQLRAAATPRSSAAGRARCDARRVRGIRRGRARARSRARARADVQVRQRAGDGRRATPGRRMRSRVGESNRVSSVGVVFWTREAPGASARLHYIEISRRRFPSTSCFSRRRRGPRARCSSSGRSAGAGASGATAGRGPPSS